MKNNVLTRLLRGMMLIMMVMGTHAEAASFMTITPALTQLSLHPNSTTSVGYTVTNNTSKPLRGIILATLGSDAQNVSVASNHCSSLSAYESCQFTLQISGNHQSGRFTIAPTVCASNGAICSTVSSNARLVVNFSTTEHAYIGLSTSVLPITLVPGGVGVVGNGIGGFLLNEPTGIVVNSSGSLAYVTDTGSNAVIVINVATNSIVARIPVGNVPTAIAISPDNQYLYTVNYNNGQYAGTLSKINTITNQVVGNPVPVGNGPWSITLTRDGSRIYVANRYDKTISVIDASTGILVTTIILPDHAIPYALLTNPNGEYVYVSAYQQNPNDLIPDGIGVISTATNTLVNSIALGIGSKPKGLAISPDGSILYVALSVSQAVSSINTINNVVTDTIPVGISLVGLALSSDGNQMVATSDTAPVVTYANLLTGQFEFIDVPGVQVSLGSFIG